MMSFLGVDYFDCTLVVPLCHLNSLWVSSVLDLGQKMDKRPPLPLKLQG